MAVTSVITLSSILAWVVYHFVLLPFGLTFLTTIVFVVLIASFVQLLELIIKKQAPALYNMWGIYLVLIATNCIVLSVPILSVESNYSFGKSIVFAIGSGMGFALALDTYGKFKRKISKCRCTKGFRRNRNSIYFSRYVIISIPWIFRNDIRIYLFK